MKRLISVIIAVCMIISLLPALGVSAEDAGYTLVYGMKNGANYSFKYQHNVKEITYNDTNGAWRFHSQSDAGRSSIIHTGYGISSATYLNGWFAIEIDVPASGDYDLSLEHGVANTGGASKAAMWIIPSEKVTTVAEAIADERNKPITEELCFYDGTLEKAPVAVTTQLGEVTLTAGKNVVVYKALEKGGNATTIYPGKLTFTGKAGGASLLSGIKTEWTKTTINLEGKNTAEVTYELFMSDGEKAEGEYDVRYESSDENVVTVENGVVTAHGYGEADITVYAINEAGYKVESTQKISVVKDGCTIKYDIGGALLAEGIGALAKSPAFSVFDYNKTDGFWTYYDSSSSTDMPDSYLKYRPGNIQIGGGRWIAFEVFVPKAGTYTMQMYHGEYSSGVDVSVYMNKGKASTSEGYIDKYNIDNDDVANFAVVSEPKEIDNIVIPEPGKYVFTFKSGSYGSVGTFVLTSGEGQKALMSIKLEGVESGKPTVTGVMSDGSAADLTGVDITWASSDESVATIGDGVLNKKAVGETTLSARLTYEGYEYTAEYKLNVTVPPLGFGGEKAEYNFFDISSKWTPTTKPELGFGDSARNEDIRGITYEYTNETGDGNWEYYGTKPGYEPDNGDIWAYRSAGSTASSYRMKLDFGKDKWVAFKMKVPAAGKYAVDYEYTTYNPSAGISEMYIVPLVDIDEVEALLTEENLVAVTDYLAGGDGQWGKATQRCGFVEFEEAGEHLIVFKQVSSRSGGYITPRKLFLDGVNSVKTVAASVDKAELTWKETAQMSFTAKRLDGSVMNEDEYTATFTSSDEKIVTVSDTGLITAVGDGTATVTVTVTDGVETHSASVDITAVDDTEILSMEMRVPEKLYVREMAKTYFVLYKRSGNEVIVPPETITYSYSENGVAEIDADGMIKGIGDGTVSVSASADFRGEKVSAESSEIKVTLHSGKTEPNYYTYEKRNAALENIKKFSWAASDKKTAESTAKKYADNFEMLYELIPGEGVPRGRQIGVRADPEYNLCRYCGFNVVGTYGASGVGGWTIDVLARPWQVQCTECKRLFPSNDFASFYKLGLDTAGYFDVDRARSEHHKRFVCDSAKNGGECTCTLPEEEYSAEWYEFYGYGLPGGYLYNDTYSELRTEGSKQYNKDPHLTDEDGNPIEIDGKTWGVDDGFGYIVHDAEGNRYFYESTDSNGKVTKTEARHGYIALYHYTLWGRMQDAINGLANAYLYTGDIKYGRAGAILLDRIADVYPSFDLYPYRNEFFNTHGGSGYGNLQGRINDCTIAKSFSLACDAFYPVLEDDSYVINFLSEKAKEYGTADENDKLSSMKIWNNWEKGILEATFNAAKTGKINGNYGMAQHAVAAAAIVLDKEPETTEMIEWIYATNTGDDKTNIAGGNFASQIIDVVDRDGMGNEAAPNYNITWITRLYQMADLLTLYKGEKTYNPYEHPKFAQMLVTGGPISLVGTHHAQIGDTGSVASLGFSGSIDMYVSAFESLKNTPHAKTLAEYIYMRNGYTTEGLRYGIFSDDPEALEDEVSALVDENPKPVSEMMTGYGFAVLRAGNNYNSASASTANNNQRDFWIYFGRNSGHGHDDTLNLGIEAFGLNIAPELGYPANTGTDPQRLQWVGQTIAHNTVTVDEKSQDTLSIHGYPRHFDDAGKVKLMDIEAEEAYAQTENYRRTLIMVEASDDISYGVDFFRVTGGNKHTYSFHAQSETVNAISGLTMVADEVAYDEKGNPIVGSYAGNDVAYGADPYTVAAWSYETKYPRGYTWMKNVRRDTDPDESFTVDFEITDYRKAVSDNKNIHLRLTQMNNFKPSEVAFTSGSVPEKKDNAPIPETLEFLLVSHEEENADSLFTTVYEPYKGERYIESIVPVDITADEAENSGDIARAVKVAHTNGRVDYVVYATNNRVAYSVTDNETEVFKFRGFVGVYSVNANGEEIYRYVNDGDLIGREDEDGLPYTGKMKAYTGTVDTFREDLSFDNYIIVNLPDADEEVLSDITGRYVYIETDGTENGVYNIKSAVSAPEYGEGKVKLDIGTISLIRAHKDTVNIDDGYLYTIESGQTFVIPTSFADENLPYFDDIGSDLSATAGKTFNTAVTAHSPLEGETVTYVGTTLPRGASISADSGAVTWKPDSSQVGDNHFAITARDSSGREATVHFNVNVYGSTTGSSSSNTDNSSTDNSGTSTDGAGTSSGGGGGGAGGGTADTNAEGSASGNTGTTDETDDGDASDQTGENVPDASGETEKLRFTDLGNHAWAADAINSLASDGIVRGTTASTYSPAANITRADFAILLVRAFDLTSENEENFADVSVSDYFAPELAVARNTGIVNGIGDNKFAPRSTITRQDMMVIVYRAIKPSLPEGGGTAEWRWEDSPADGAATDSNGGGIQAPAEYPDYAAVAPYARDAVSALIGAGIVNGKSGLIAPNDYTTRAEVAVLLGRILEYTK